MRPPKNARKTQRQSVGWYGHKIGNLASGKNF